MEKTLGKEFTSIAERVMYLRSNCDCVVKMGYMKPFTPEKVAELKEKLAERSIEIGEIEQAKKDAAALFKAELKPLHDEKSSILRGIKERAEFVKEDCFKFVDHDDKTVGFYNADGDLIESRPANPDELQMTLMHQFRNPDIEKTGTDN